MIAWILLGALAQFITCVFFCVLGFVAGMSYVAEKAGKENNIFEHKNILYQVTYYKRER